MNETIVSADSAMDWRKQIKLNERRTYGVIFAFFLLYVGVGVLIDIFVDSSIYHATPAMVWQAMRQGLLFPYATTILFAVACCSLFLTFSMYDRIMLLGTEYREITPSTFSNSQDQMLYNVIEEMKIAAGLNYMPRVFVINADYMNAFASGYSERSAMVAITQGLLNKLDRSELQAVMAHELSHIRHHDIKLTLTTSVLSNIMLLAIDILFYNIIYGRSGQNDNRKNGLIAVIIILRYLLPLITILLMLYLNRTREYMADAGCVELMRDNTPLGRALMKIDQDHQAHKQDYAFQYGNTAHEQVRRAAYLYDPVTAGIEPVKSLDSLFSTHPSIANRLKALGFGK